MWTLPSGYAVLVGIRGTLPHSHSTNITGKGWGLGYGAKYLTQGTTTSGEKALEQAFTGGFPSGVKLRCMSHFRNNNLKALEVSERNEIIDQIFGYNTGDGVYHEGMVDADSPQMFDTLYESVWEKWEKKCPPFVCWFDKNTSLVKETMLANVHVVAWVTLPRNSTPTTQRAITTLSNTTRSTRRCLYLNSCRT